MAVHCSMETLLVLIFTQICNQTQRVGRRRSYTADVVAGLLASVSHGLRRVTVQCSTVRQIVFISVKFILL